MRPSSLRVAELVWKEGSLIKDYPPESYDMKNLEDVWEYLKTEDAAKKFETCIRGWMKQIQELLLESEQLRLETDDAGPQVLSDSRIKEGLSCVFFVLGITVRKKASNLPLLASKTFPSTI